MRGVWGCGILVYGYMGVWVCGAGVYGCMGVWLCGVWVHRYVGVWGCGVRVYGCMVLCWYGAATISRLLKIIGLFCRISSLLYGSFAKEIYKFKEPTSCSHPVCGCISHHQKRNSLFHEQNQTRSTLLQCVAGVDCWSAQLSGILG